jgi:hypothetical protein
MKKIFILFLFSSLFLTGCGTKPETDAYIMSQMFVEKRLKAPKTAKFPHISKIKVESANENRWLIKSYVDSENGYGAVVRQEYRAIVEHLEGDKWKLIKLNMQ